MRYAVIKNGFCVNIVLSDADFAKMMGWVLLPEGYGIGDSYVDGIFRHTIPECTVEPDIQENGSMSTFDT